MNARVLGGLLTIGTILLDGFDEDVLSGKQTLVLQGGQRCRVWWLHRPSNRHRAWRIFAAGQTELADQAVVVGGLLHVRHRRSQIVHLAPKLPRQLVQRKARRSGQRQELTSVK